MSALLEKLRHGRWLLEPTSYRTLLETVLSNPAPAPRLAAPRDEFTLESQSMGVTDRATAIIAITGTLVKELL